MSKPYTLTLLFDIRAWQKVEFTAADNDAAKAYGRRLADAIKSGDGIPTDHPIENQKIETDWDGLGSPTVIVDAYGDDGDFLDEVICIEASKPDPVRDAAPAMLEALEAAWDFIENVSDDTPDRTDRFFALREMVRETFAAARGEG